jgi:uncharacterized protein YhbP (UPF0306 family)
MNDKLTPVRTLLHDQTTLVLASCSGEPIPRSTPLFFIADEALNLYWYSSRSSLHSGNCAMQPEASISIYADARTWQQIRGVQMQGRVSIVSDRILRKSITAQYIDRFALGNLFSFAIRRSSLYRFTPHWLRYLDNAKRFGYKFELDL